MSFKFSAKNLETGRTGAITVKAPTEQAARHRLEMTGYQIVRLLSANQGLGAGPESPFS